MTRAHRSEARLPPAARRRRQSHLNLRQASGRLPDAQGARGGMRNRRRPDEPVGKEHPLRYALVCWEGTGVPAMNVPVTALRGPWEIDAFPGPNARNPRRLSPTGSGALLERCSCSTPSPARSAVRPGPAPGWRSAWAGFPRRLGSWPYPAPSRTPSAGATGGPPRPVVFPGCTGDNGAEPLAGSLVEGKLPSTEQRSLQPSGPEARGACRVSPDPTSYMRTSHRKVRNSVSAGPPQ